jgi:hypothetical protein
MLEMKERRDWKDGFHIALVGMFLDGRRILITTQFFWISTDAPLYSHLPYKRYVLFSERQLDLEDRVCTGPRRLANLTVLVGV